MADQKAPHSNVGERVAPSTSYDVPGNPEDYRYVLRGADLVLIDHDNEEHVFLFVGNIMSLNGQVNMHFANGATLDSQALFERAEMAQVEPYEEDEVSWDARDEEDPDAQGNTDQPDGEQAAEEEDGADEPGTEADVSQAQADPLVDLKQQILSASRAQNDYTSNKSGDAERNDNISPVINTNTTDKLGAADDEEPEKPEEPTLAAPHFALTEDTNSGSTLDFVTKFTSPQFEGTAEPNAEVTLYVNGAAVATTTATEEGEFLFVIGGSYAEGTYEVYVEAAKYGLTAVSKTEELVIDTTPPTLPSITLAAASDLGVSNADKLTCDTTPTLKGEYASGDLSEVGTTLIVEARKDGTGDFEQIGTTTVQSDGTWSYTVPDGSALEDGTWEFRLAAVDVAGNRTPADAATLSGVVIDSVAPVLGSALTLVEDTANPDMTGTDSDYITSDNQFALGGTASNDATVRVTINGVTVGETTPAGGAWSFAAGDFDFGSLSVAGNNAQLADGTYTLVVQAFDDAGNATTAIQKTLVIDTDVVDPHIAITGMVDPVGGYYYIGESNPVFTLTGEAHSTGTFAIVDTATGLPVAATLEIRWDESTSSYTFASPATLANGTYQATFTNMDAAGNQETTTLDFKIDTDRPPSPILSVEDTGSSESPADPITNNPALTISFAAGAELDNVKEVRVYLTSDGASPDMDNDTYYLASRQGDSWTLSPAHTLALRNALAAGYSGATQDYSYTVVVVDNSGRTDKLDGEAYESTDFTYDTIAPTLAGLDLVTDPNDPAFDGQPEDYRVDADDASLTDADKAVIDTTGDPVYVVPVKPTFGGSCEAGTDVTIILSDGSSTTLVTGSDSWSYTFGNNADGDSFALTKGEMNKVTILSTDAAGNTTTEVVYIKVAGDPPAAPSVDLVDSYNTGVTSDDITRGLDDGSAADVADRDGLVRVHGTAPGAAYVVVTYVDEGGVTRTLTTTTGSEHIPVSDGLWTSPEVLLTDTSSTTHTGTDYTFTVTAYDAANQPSSATQYTATIDRTTTVSTIDLESDSSGPAHGTTIDYGAGLTGTTDDRTSLSVENNKLTLTGANVEDGSTVYLVHTYNGVTQVISYAEYRDLVPEAGGETGSWSIDLDATDARLTNFTLDGEHTFVARAVDPAGNVTDSAPITVFFDSTAPTVGATELAAEDNSAIDARFVSANPALAALNAAYATDSITREPNFTLTGTLDAEATDEADNVAVNVYRGAVQIGVAQVATDGDGNVSWTFDFASGINAGQSADFTFHVEVVDRAGNVTVGDDVTITVDRTPPAIGSFGLAAADDTYYDAANPSDDLGTSSDNYTGAADLTLHGSSTVSAPVLIEYSLDGSTWTSLYAIANGSTAASGTNWTQDGAGNWTYTVNVNTLKANLGAAATETVTFRATAADSAGNEVSDTFSVDVDRHAPQGTTLDLHAGSDTADSIAGTLGLAAVGSNSDDRTSADSLYFTGEAEAGARVEIYRVGPGSDYSEASPGTLLDVVTADASTGRWNYTHAFDTDPSGGVDADGTYEFVAVAVDAAGNRGAAVVLEVTRDTTVQAVPTLALNAASTTNDSTPAGAGAGAANPLITAGTWRVDGEGHTYLDKSSITLQGELTGYNAVQDPVAAYVYRDGTLMGRATISGTTWTYAAGSLTDGATYAYTLVLEDAAGNTVETSPLYVKIDASTGAPSVDLIDADDSAGGYFYSGTADPSAGDTDNVTNTGANLSDPVKAFTLTGTVAEQGSTVTLYVARRLSDGSWGDYEEVDGAVTQPAGASTAWSCTVLDADLSGDGSYRFLAVAEDASGNTAEKTLDITVDSRAPVLMDGHELWLNNDSGAQDLRTNAATLQLQGRLADLSDQDVVLYISQDGGAPVRVTNIDWSTGKWSFEYTPALNGTGGTSLPEGAYSFVLYAEDRAGNLTTYPPSGAYDVVIDRSLGTPTIDLATGSDTYGGPARADADSDGQPDGAGDDYTGYVAAHGTDIHLRIDADSDSTVAVYVKNIAEGDVPFDPDNPENGYDLVQAGITYNVAAGKWDTLVFDASAYAGATSDVTLVVVSTDGSQTRSSSYTFTLDDQAPAAVAGDAIDWEPASATASHITAGAVVPNATNGKAIVLSGAVAGENQTDVTVEIFDSMKSTQAGSFGARISLGYATVHADGTWTFTAGSVASPVAEAYHQYVARIEDNAGNVTEVALADLLVDRSAPTAPALAMVGSQDTDYTDGLTETGGDGYYLDNKGTGTTTDDVYYNDNSSTPFRLTGLEVSPGTVLSISIDGGAAREVAITGSTHSFTPDAALADGSHTVQAWVTDAAGNVSETSTINFVVDTQNPTITDVGLDAASNTGSADDSAAPVTSAATPTIEGQSEARAAITVEVRDDKGTADTSDDTVYTASTVADASGHWEVAVSGESGAAIDVGSYDVTATAIDRAGNTTVAEDVASFSVDRTVEVADGSFGMVANEVNDTGFASDDRYTSENNPAFSWRAEEAVSVRLLFYKSGIATPVRSVAPPADELLTVDGVTTWYPSDLDLGDGSYTVKAVFTDLEAGNATDPDDNAVSFVIDTTSTALSANLADASDTGIDNDWVTNPALVGGGADTLTIEGSAPSGTTPATEVRVQVYLVAEDGTRTLLAPDNAATAYVATAADGTWSYDVSAAGFVPGENSLVIVSTDLAGNTTEIGRTLTIDTELDPGTVILAANNTVNSTVNGGLNNSGTYAEDGDFVDDKTNDVTPRLAGTTEPHSTVDLWLGDPDAGGVLIAANIPTDANGYWYFDVDTDARTSSGTPLLVAMASLADTSADLDGTDYTFYARVTDQAGNVADATGTITIDTQAPDADAATARISSAGVVVGEQTVYSDTGLDHTDGYTSSTRPTLTGSVPEGNTRVDVYVTYPGDADPTYIGTTKSNASGAWTLDIPNSAQALAGSPTGTDYEISIKVWDDAGNESDFGPAATVTVDNGFADMDADIAGVQPALIRFGAAFDAENADDAVYYDEADHTLKTNITSPVFDVTMEADCDTATLTLVRLGADGNPVSNPVVDVDIFVISLGPGHAGNPPADGHWDGVQFETSTGADALLDGEWRLVLTGTDKAGNSFEQTQDLHVNGVPPAFTVEIVEDQDGQAGVGLYAGDAILNAQTVHLSGEFAADVDYTEVKRVSIVNAVDSSVVATLEADEITGNTWVIEASNLAAGANTYSFYVVAEDNFGNEYWYPSSTDPLTYTVDRNAPVLNQESVDLVAADDSAGIIYATDHDDATTERTLHIAFGGEANSKVELILDGAVLFTAMPPDPSDSGAAYTYALGSSALAASLPPGVTYDAATNKFTYATDALEDGDWTFTVRVTDLAGNVSTQDLTVTVDNVYADASLTADLAAGSDQGSYGDNLVAHDDNLSNEVRPELSGNAEPGSAVRIYLQRFDSLEDARNDTAFAVSGDSWYDSTPHTEILVADDESSWSWDAVQQSGADAGQELADGYYKVIVVSEDQAGNRPAAETFVFGKDTDAPSEATDADALTFHLQDKVESTALLNEGSSTAGEVQAGEFVDSSGNPIWVTTNWMPTIGGVAETGSRLTIVLRIDGDLDGSLDDPTAIYKQLTIDVTDPDGNWSFDFSGEQTGAGRLADGIYTVEITCTDAAGNSTTLSPSPQFQISSIPPSPPTVRLAQEDDSYNAQTSNDGITNHNTGLTLTGTAEAGAVVRIYRSGAVADTNELITDAYLAAHLLATVTADASGIWTYELPTDFEEGGSDPDVVEDGSYRFFVGSDYFNGNTYYSLQEVNAEGQALINADGSAILRQPEEILEDDGTATGTYTYPDYVLEVDTALATPTFELGLILDMDTSKTEVERMSNSSRMDSGIGDQWRTPEEIAAGKYLGESDDFWQTPGELAAEGHADSTYNDWIVKTSGPTIEGTVEAGSIVYVDRWMVADLTDDGVENPLAQWVQVGVVEQESTADGTWRFVFPAEYENAQYDVRIRVVDQAGNTFVGTTENGGRHTITIDAEIQDTVLDLPSSQDTELLWDGVATGTAWGSIDDAANLVIVAADGTTRVLDYVHKGHLSGDFESGNADDLTTENNLLLSGAVEAGSRMYLTDTRAGVTVAITPVLVVDPAAALDDASATEAYYVKVNDSGDVGTWVWLNATAFNAAYGADYDGVYFHIQADGSWEYRTGELTDAKHAYTIENIDLAGNRAVTTPLAVTVDHDFASAAIGLSQSSDAGPFGNDDPAYDDRITNDDTPSVRLYGSSGATYLLYVYRVNEDGTVGENVNADGAPVATGVHASGVDTWVELDFATYGDGGYQLRLVNVSESGHVSEAIYPPTEADGTYVADDDWDVGSSTHPLVIDTVAPVIPDQAAIEANPDKVGDYYAHVRDGDLADPVNEWNTPVVMSNGQPLPIIISGDAVDVDGTGIKADLITNDTTPTIQVFVEPGTMIAVSGMGYSSYLTDSDNDGIITLDPSTARNDGNPYADGTYAFTIRFGDIAGNITDTTATFSLTIDSHGPSASIGLDDASDTGTFAVDNVTNDTTPTLSGIVSADAIRYEIEVGGTIIERHVGDADFGTLVTDAGGNQHYEWTYTPTLENGEYDVSITAWDRAGNATGDGLDAYHPDNPETVTHDVPLIVHDTGALDLYAGCEQNRSGTRIYLDVDWSASDAYNDADNVYAGPNHLIFTYHYLDGSTSTETVEMTLGETEYSSSLRTDDNYSYIEFKFVDSAGNESEVASVDIGSGPDADGVYHIDHVSGGLDDIPAVDPTPDPTPAAETVDVEFELGGHLSDDNTTDSLTLDDVAHVRATITGDVDGDGDQDVVNVDATLADDGSWSLHFRQELAATGDFHLDLTALKADGSEVTLATDHDLTYDFSVLTEQMAQDQGADTQVLFDADAENNQAAPADTPDPGVEATVTIHVDPVVVDEHLI
ncbi:MAG: Ig-like domain repeat protein [Desulfovibrionaceae bacterium]|jgi:hypothetical protein|nr:Ig-like domain repeat protein [Desulfovibrionaceae bacterium]